MLLEFCKNHRKTPALESLQYHIKERLQQRLCYSLVIFAKKIRIPFLQNQTMLLTFHCNSLIKKNLSDISIIGCLVFFGNFTDKHLLMSLLWHWGCSLFLSTWNLKISECYRKHFQLNHIGTSCISLLGCSRIVITNLFKNILLHWKFVLL